MRRPSQQTFLSLIVASALAAGLTAAAGAEPDRLAPAPLASKDRAGFGAAIVFTASAYTPPGIVSLAGRPLASQDRAGFGAAIVFTASAYTPDGIVSLAGRPLASRDQAGFGEAIVFTASGYTPDGIGGSPAFEVVGTR